MLNKGRLKAVVFVKLKRYIFSTFTTKIQNVKNVILKEVYNFTLIIIINYQINGKNIMIKKREKSLQY